jgi:hypothetical protein
MYLEQYLSQWECPLNICGMPEWTQWPWVGQDTKLCLYSLQSWIRSGWLAQMLLGARWGRILWEHIYFLCMWMVGIRGTCNLEISCWCPGGAGRQAEILSCACSNPLVPFGAMGPRWPHPFTYSAHLLSDFKVPRWWAQCWGYQLDNTKSLLWIINRGKKHKVNNIILAGHYENKMGPYYKGWLG